MPLFLFIVLAASAIAGVAPAQGTAETTAKKHLHAMTGDAPANAMTVKRMPTEPGQGAFAAIAEIVAMLRANPDTDWSKVNITALRNHLVDMDMLVTRARVTSSPIDGGLDMHISLAGRGGAAAGRMVPMHAPMLARETGWKSELKKDDGMMDWRVTSPADALQIRALGFYGLMAQGAHHQPHHLALATGQAR